MKRTSTIFSLVIAISVIGSTINTNGQGRARERDSDRNRDRANHQDRSNHNDRDRYDQHDNDRDHRDRHSVRHVYHHDRRYNHQPVVVHHHYGRPRYIYYRDYDVYYDRTNNVYISSSGRGWKVTTALPVVMHRVNIRNTKRFEVDYYDDDFPRYLETRRPSYGRECEDW